MDWYIGVLKKYMVFTGRARRKEYWMFVLINFFVTVALAMLEGMLGVPGTLSSFYGLVVFIPTLAVGVRRLHDTGRSGWWLLLALIPVLGTIVLIVFFCFDSEEGTNEYGVNPKLGEVAY